MKLAYVTDLEHRLSGGGSYAVNWHAYDQLSRGFQTVYAGPIVPRPPLFDITASKIRRRILHRPGKFSYFSAGTLSDNAGKAAAAIPRDIDAVVFRSATRWCRTKVTVPYFVYLDAVFHTFFNNTFRDTDFIAADVQRICNEEASFLERAHGVFFESRWGMNKAIEAYQPKRDHYISVGRGGVLSPPVADEWKGNTHQLLTIAMNFRQKGGDIVLSAFRRLKQRFPSLTWRIVGAPPEGDWRSVDGIQYEGILSPDDPLELARLRELLAQSSVLVHPTREDTSPLVITEAAYFGCPSISVRRFAIPELIEDGISGVLLDAQPSANSLAEAIASLISDEGGYRAMRVHARAAAINKSSWPAIGTDMVHRIRTALG